ncbi:MAG: dihydrodipicolinate synthase family protein [Burkholderiaceae bacterium]
MKYRKNEAKQYAREHMRGIWAAALNPMLPDFSIDEAGLRQNIAHWVDDLKIQGLFIAGKQGEFFSMTVAERKRNFEVAVQACGDRASTIMSCSDQNFDTVIELAKHAQAIGADYIVVHAPVLHFIHDREETLLNYYKTICDEVDIGIALWSHPDSGYLMSPQLCRQLADLPNIVAIKYSVPREMYSELSRLAGETLLVSTASEDEWLDNLIELDWRLYLCSSPPYLLQSRHDLRMHEYTELAFAGRHDEARKVSASLAPVRQALKSTRPGGKPQAHQKVWQSLLGQAGGPVRPPLLQMTEPEIAATREAFKACGLKV